MSRIAIIGGGLAGLAAAYWASQAGLEVVVLEATQRFGGHTRTAKLDAIALELGEESFDDWPPVLLDLCGQLKLEPTPSPNLRQIVLQGGRNWVLPAGLNLFSGFGLHQITKLPFSQSVRWRLGMERFVATPPAKDELMGAFLRRKLGPEVWAVLEPYLSAMLGGPAEEVSAQAALGRLIALERQGGLLAGSRKLSNPGRWQLAGGMGSLIEALGKHLPSAKLLPQHEVWALTRDARHWQVHVRGGSLSAEAIFMALPAPQAAKVFRPSAPQLTTLLNHFPHQHSAKVYLLYRHGELAEPTEYFFARGEGYTSSAIKLTHPSPDLALVRAQFMGEAARWSDSDLAKQAQQDLARLRQIEARPLAAWVFRQPSSRPQFTQGHAQRVAHLEQELVYAPGLFLTGSYLAGPGLANLVEHAHQTIRRALDFLAL
ncbi:protoporphyrinogen oxidase [Meiothermus sp.]|jgi:oxygen-dependent protoporphyrinogen oxidase|uniref:protoporphyrinogen oxidase n=1 Tax=Meiothermus sp. TaxID=1955249 RepID=UPI0021DE5ABA|nr:protoporphyrinogen oxidase [Meiothermus sp.]GIW24154.1 MAG: protoporphyrinogen oxidase [Meiothermus sp.]